MPRAVVVAPYLPIRDELKIGPWRLTPVDDLADSQILRKIPARRVRMLLKAYGMPGSGAGAVASLNRGRVGGEVKDRSSVQKLHWSLIYAVLSSKEAWSDAWEPRATADNALVWAHPFDDSTFAVIFEGGVLQELQGFSLDRPVGTHLEIPRPSGLLPFGAPLNIDYELASAVHEGLSTGRQNARRLGQALEWLGFAWMNSAAISGDARIVALRTAYESLLSTGKKSDQVKMRERLSRLLTPRAPKTPQSWTEPSGRVHKKVRLSEMEWWFQKFTLLRNEIIHGDAIRKQDRDFGGESHLMLATDNLFRLIPRMLVKEQGYSEDLLMTALDREVLRKLRAAGKP